MTQEQKDLLLRDLSVRLPYNVKVHAKYTDLGETIELDGIVKMIDADGVVGIEVINDFSSAWTYVQIDNVKPYLFPLSSMTKEQLFEAQEILGKHEIEIEDGFLSIVDSNRKTISYLEILALLEWFYKNHFDIYGFIPMDLAIDATSLNIY